MVLLVLTVVALLCARDSFALSPAERAAVWTRIWTTTNEHFIGFERIPYVNWEQQYQLGLDALQKEPNEIEFWRDLRKRIALLENGCTYLRFPTSLPRTYDTVPVRLLLAGDKILVRNLSSAPDLERAGVRIGDELISLDGVPAFDYIRAVCVEQTSGSTFKARLATGVHRLFVGPAGSRAQCVWRRPDGTDYEAALLRDSGQNSAWMSETDRTTADDYRKLGSGIFYLNLRSSITRTGQESLLETIRSSSPKAMILDLRDTQTGIFPSDFLRSVLEYPVQAGAARYVRTRPRESTGLLGTQELEHVWMSRGGELLMPTNTAFTGKLVCLVGRETSDAAERLLQPLIESGRVTLIGDTTAGSGYDRMVVQLGDGAALSLAVTQPTWADGFGDAKGFVPAIAVTQTAAGLASGRDDVFERALEFLRHGK